MPCDSYFLSQPTEENLRPTEREKRLLQGLFDWQKSSASSVEVHYVFMNAQEHYRECRCRSPGGCD